MAVAVQSEKLRELVDENAEVEQIATGFTFTEGPIWMADGSLHFSDMPGDKRRRWHPDEGVTVLRDPSNKCNGMTLDNDGNLIVCEHVTSSVVRESPGRDARDARHALGRQGAEQPERRDRRLATARSSSPTRPTGACPASASSASRSSTSRASTACRRGGGDLQLLVDDFAQPNGLCFSPDESLLYINDTDARAHPRLRRRPGPRALERPRVRRGHRRRRPREGRARRRDEARRARQRLRHRARRASGSSRRTASTSA